MKKIYLSILLILLLLPYNFVLGAIAVDNTEMATPDGVSSITLSFTCSGDDRLLLVSVGSYSSVARDVSSIKYNNVTMTQLHKVVREASGSVYDNYYMYYLIAPDTGTHNIVVTYNGTISYPSVVAASYTGVSQSGFPDASDTIPVTSSVSNLTKSLTTVADNSWVIMGIESNANPVNAISGCVARETDMGYLTIFDSNSAKTPAGSVSFTVDPSYSSGNTNGGIFSIAPATGAPPVTNVPTSDGFMSFD